MDDPVLWVINKMDIKPSIKSAIRKRLRFHRFWNIEDLCSKSEEELLQILDSDDKSLEVFKKYLRGYGLSLGMSEKDLLDYQDAEYYERHPEEKSQIDTVPNEDAPLKALQEENLVVSVEEALDGSEEKALYDGVDGESIEEQQEDKPEPSTEQVNLIVETSFDEDSMTEDEARDKLDEINRKELYYYDPYEYFKPGDWEITLHSAAIRFMASDSWLTRLFMSDEKRLVRAIKNAKSLYESLCADAHQRGEKSRVIRKQCKEERKRILEKFPEIFHQKTEIFHQKIF